MLRAFVFVGALALASAQFNQGFTSRTPAQSTARPSQTTNQFQHRRQQQPSNQQQPSQYQQQSNQFQQQSNQYQQQSNQYQQQSNQYQQQGSQYQQQQKLNAGTCRETNERYPVSGSCDKYVECLNGTSEEKTCPDGLRFNPDLKFNVYPCQYPIDVPCLERSALQPAQPTEECPHQFGYFRLGDARNCSGFRNCVNGRGYDLQCPDGLAFNSETYQCDWPDLVADCDAEAFVGFRCPEIPQSKELGQPAGFRFYSSDADCQKYFLCVEGRPRSMSCGASNGFDELTSSCVSADEVSTCPAELRQQAARRREEELQRLAKTKQFEDKRNNKIYGNA